MDDEDEAPCDYCDSVVPVSELRSTPLPKDRALEHRGICRICWARTPGAPAWPPSRVAQALAEARCPASPPLCPAPLLASAVSSPPKRQFPSKPPPPLPPAGPAPPSGHAHTVSLSPSAAPRTPPVEALLQRSASAVAQRPAAAERIRIGSAQAQALAAEAEGPEAALRASWQGGDTADAMAGFRTLRVRPLMRTERMALLDAFASSPKDDSELFQRKRRPSSIQLSDSSCSDVSSASPSSAASAASPPPSPGVAASTSPTAAASAAAELPKSTSFSGRVGALKRLVSRRDTSISRPIAVASVDAEDYRPRRPDDVAALLGRPEALAAAARAMDCSLPWTAPGLVDCWSTVAVPAEKWARASSVSTELMCLVARSATSDGFHVECCRASVTCEHAGGIPGSDLHGVLAADGDYPYFKELIMPGPHEHWCGSETVLSLEDRVSGVVRGFLRTKRGSQRVLLPSLRHIKVLKAILPKIKDVKFVRATKTEELSKALVAFDQKNMCTCYKFGVLLCRQKQHDENEIFSNVTQDASRAYRDFLDLMGETIALKGWTKYRGGLDVRDNNTGETSVYTTLDQYEIMFHVATMLPFQPGDPQRVERKRHIGNDVCVVIFKEQSDPGDTLNPKIFTSHFNHSFFVVSPVLEADGTTSHYFLSIANKPAVPPYPPFFPKEAMFERGPAFREYLLTKLINAERSALANSPEFSSIASTRKSQLGELCSKFL
eukprot:m51a1_g5859 hypothetical protein (721) ;mRNA; r:376946-380446